MALQQYKCTACGGALNFDSETQMLLCPYCDSIYHISDFAQVDESLNQTVENVTADWEPYETSYWQEGENMRSYVCKSCGGEIIGDANLAATNCPYCGNAIVMTQQLSGDLKPDSIIPFKKDKQAAINGFIEHVADKKYVPKIFRDKKHIESIQGYYVPFWLYSGHVDATAAYRATTSRTWREGDYQCTETKEFAPVRDASLDFEYLPTDASQQMDDALMDSLEEFDYSDLVEFKTGYLAGYLAHKYDVSMEEDRERAENRMKNATKDALDSSVTGYDSVQCTNARYSLSDLRAHYAFMPVWILDTKYNNQNYRFAMNGQTGKMVGDVPVDKKAAFGSWLLWTVILAAAAWLIWHFKDLVALIQSIGH